MSFRFRDGSQINGVPVQDAIEAIDGWITSRNNESPSADNFAATLPVAAAPAPAAVAAAPAPAE